MIILQESPIQYFKEHWLTILLALWSAREVIANRIANALPAPTAEDGPEYRRWFKIANRAAGNFARADNNAAIEQSPNFIPAAEAYMQKKLAEQAAVKQGG